MNTDLKDTYNRIAEDWHTDHQEDTWWVEGTDTFAHLLRPGGLVLDVGCGSGVKSKYLVNKGFKVTGLDFSDGLLDIAKREVPEAEFRLLDMRDVPQLDGEFDGIFAQASLLHIPKAEAQAVIYGFASKLSDGGYLYVAVKGMRPGGVQEEVKREADYGYEYERFFSYYTMSELEEYFKNAGLAVVYIDTQGTGKSDWLQIIGKKS